MTSTKGHSQWTSTEWHQQNDINRVTSTKWLQQNDIHICTVWTWLLLPLDSVRYDFIPFTCRQWVPTSMIRTGRTPMTTALSKTERSILHGLLCIVVELVRGGSVITGADMEKGTTVQPTSCKLDLRWNAR